MKQGMFIAMALWANCTIADARGWPEAGGWSIGEADDSCGMMQTYEGKGETQLSLLISLSGSVGLVIENSDWSIVDGQKYDLDFVLNGSTYGGGAVVGTAKGYKKGFVAKFGDDFAKDFSAGSSLLIYRGDTLVDQLSLTGTASGVAMVRRCLAAKRAEIAAVERDRQRFAHIADDPFATKQTESEKERFGTQVPAPRANPSSWFSDADYPARAQREGRSGTVRYTLNVSTDGSVESCQVTGSSGHADLDEATCRIIQRRGHFTGGPGKFESTTNWKLPE